MPRRARGYAMAIVLLISVLLSAALTSMFFALSSATKLTAKNLGARRAQYVCDGVVALAGFELRRASVRSTTLDVLNDALDPLRAGIVADGVVIDELRAEASTDSRRTVVPSGGLAGMEVSVVDLDLRIALRSPEAPPCRARHVQPLASLSFFQFPAFSVSGVVVAGNGPSFVANLPPQGYLWGKSASNSAGRVEGRTMTTAPLTLPEAPTHMTPTPTDLRFLLQQPGTGHPAAVVTPPPEPLGNRIAFSADLRIIDGEWFLRDPDRPAAWPGVPLWSDHPCSDATSIGPCSNTVGSSSGDWFNDAVVRRRLYSRYERNANGFLDSAGGAGVVSYGSIVGGSGGDAFEPAGFAPASLCSNDPGTFRKPVECVSTDPSNDGPRAALADAARAGFRDPDLDVSRTPINVDVGLLGTAMATLGKGELGDFLCLPLARGVPGTCRRVFNGIVYISANRGSPTTTAPPFTPIASDARVAPKLPWPLCGELSSGQDALETGEDPGYFDELVQRGCADDDFARIDSVRLMRASDLSAFQHTGLTVVSDLPVYLQGDWNVDGASAGARSAIMTERFTAVSTRFSDGFAPPLGPVAFPALPSPAPPTPSVSLRASLFAGNAGTDSATLVRVIEPVINVAVDGALAAGFQSAVANRRPSRLTWRYPRELLSGAPTEQPPSAPRATFILPGARRP
ncbi:MAG: hypothetical protein Q8O67_03660 [Deltaproteobacteria bacterium]|nr:hypothetical protein [Deltaproteobacteria bacterium]